VGIKIDVEPRVHHNQEVTLNLTVEVSQLGDEVTVGPNQSAVTIGTRTITSVIRLRNGETSLLAGLLRVDRSESSSETPGLSQIPILGRLFTIKGKKESKSELVLTLTPHIVRFPDIQEEDLAPVWVGTESRIAFYGNRPRVTSGRHNAGPFDRGTRARPQIPIRRVPTPSRPVPEVRGVQSGSGNLVPGGKAGEYQPDSGDGSTDALSEYGEKDGEDGEDGEDESIWGDRSKVATQLEPGELPLEGPALVVGLEPSVVTVVAGGQTELQLVASGADADAYRLSLDLSFDPKRIRILELDPGQDVAVLDHQLDDVAGGLSLDLMAAEAGDDGADGPEGMVAAPRVLGTLLVEALEEGPVPLFVTSQQAVDGTGEAMPVATGDGAIYVQAETPSAAEVTESQALVPVSELRSEDVR
jgi:general secretion pathway protein D